MPDISMCQNEACPLKEKCYRFRAIPSPDLQAYNYYKPDQEGNCSMYLNYNDLKDESKSKHDG